MPFDLSKSSNGSLDERLARSPILLAFGVTCALFLLASFFIGSSFYAIRAIDQQSRVDESLRAAAALDDMAQLGGTFDAAGIGRLAARFNFHGAHLNLASGITVNEASLPLPVAAGAASAAYRFAWTPARPGSEIFLGTSLMRYAVAFAMFMLIGFIFFRFHRLARKLDEGRKAARELASRDSLTGLFNRLTFEQNLDAALAEAAVHGQPMALLYLDLDGFKQINDTIGHAAGDAVLRSVAGRLLQLCGPDDTVARLGGDEFAVIRPRAGDPANLAEFSMGLQAALALPHDIDGRAQQVGASIGVAISPDRGISADELLQRADVALYRAKALPDRPFVLFEQQPQMVVSPLPRVA